MLERSARAVFSQGKPHEVPWPIRPIQEIEGSRALIQNQNSADRSGEAFRHQHWLPVWEKMWRAHGTCSTDRPVLTQTLKPSLVVARCGAVARLAEKSRFLKGRACSPYRSFSEIHESPGCVSGSAKLSEKRMHFVREKRDKPPGRRFHAGKRLSDKREKREKSPDGGRPFDKLRAGYRERWPKISALKAL
jgi:hypothetical protein